MTRSGMFLPKPIEGMTEIAASPDSRLLDNELNTYLRGRFSIGSAHYYLVPGTIPWIAISKSIQNQMAENAIQGSMFEWHEPGIDFIDIYPQAKNKGAFALAMRRGSRPDSTKLVGFYWLNDAQPQKDEPHTP